MVDILNPRNRIFKSKNKTLQPTIGTCNNHTYVSAILVFGSGGYDDEVKMEHHQPRMYKACILLFFGFLFLGLCSYHGFEGYVLVALGLMSTGCYLLLVLEMVLLFLEKYEELYSTVTEAIRAATSLTPEMRELMGFGIEKWIDTKPVKPKPERIFLGLKDDHQTILSLPLPALQFKPFAQALLNDVPFSENQWVLIAKTMSAPQFRKIQDIFLANRYAEYRNPEHPKQGAKLTSAGKAAMRYIVNQKALPTF